MAVVHRLDSKDIKLSWNLENKRVSIVCHSPKLASAYMASLLQQKRLGTIGAIFFKESDESNVTWLICGEQIIHFVQDGMKQDYKTKGKFTDFLTSRS